MQDMPENSIDSIVTDPPYELGFMGKTWDNTGVAYNVKVWKEALRVLKPGGHLLSFGGTRTYHRMACAIEDAGFEIRDQLQWVYGGGFPKSMDISKAIDKAKGALRTVIGQGKAGISSRAFQSESATTAGSYALTVPKTPEAIQWDGWGTALKPANEPVVLARKPLSDKTIAANVLQWGTGGINIDDCRIGRDTLCAHGGKTRADSKIYGSGKGLPEVEKGSNAHIGRFPANLILDGEAGKALDRQTGILKSGSNSTRTKAGTFLEHGGLGKAGDVQTTYGDQGGAARFFYCAKASKAERGEGNTHPTVKPLALMQYLIRLITPPGGIVLDPFAGSGTTGVACVRENKKFYLIEKEERSYQILLSRVDRELQKYILE